MTFSVAVKNTGQTFNCPADKSLLASMEHQQLNAVRVGCRGGGCGVCLIRILSGEFHARKMSIKQVTPQQQKQGMALSCRVFPRSDLIIESINNNESRKMRETT